MAVGAVVSAGSGAPIGPAVIVGVGIGLGVGAGTGACVGIVLGVTVGTGVCLSVAARCAAGSGAAGSGEGAAIAWTTASVGTGPCVAGTATSCKGASRVASTSKTSGSLAQAIIVASSITARTGMTSFEKLDAFISISMRPLVRIICDLPSADSVSEVVSKVPSPSGRGLG